MQSVVISLFRLFVQQLKHFKVYRLLYMVCLVCFSLSYFVKDDGLSAWAIDVNAHYVFKLSDMFGFYPLAGLDLSFWKVSLGNSASLNKTRLGANIGLGGEVYATDQLSVGLEFKYNILKSWGDLRLSQPLLALRIGYNF